MNTLWDTWEEKWALGERRSLCDDECLWVMRDSPRGGQAMLWHDQKTHTRCFNVIPYGQKTFTYRCWLDNQGKQGFFADDGDPYKCQLPDEANKLLRYGLPLPRTQSLYGMTKGNRVVAIYMPWHSKHDDDLSRHVASFVLQGEKEPGLVDHIGMRLAKWWEAVDSHKLVLLDEKVKQSKGLIEMSKYKGCYRYILVRDEEPWTGITGSALYALSDAPSMTLAEALRLHGDDARCAFE